MQHWKLLVFYYNRDCSSQTGSAFLLRLGQFPGAWQGAFDNKLRHRRAV
jgi:hypothetical protein